MHFNPVALRMAKTLWSFGHSECNRVKESNSAIFSFAVLVNRGQLLKEKIDSEDEACIL